MCRVCTEFSFGRWEFFLYYDDDSGADYHYSGADHNDDDSCTDYHYSCADNHHDNSGSYRNFDDSYTDYHYPSTNCVQTLQCRFLSN